MAKINMAIRGIGADFGSHHEATFIHNLHPSLKADFILANPPFNYHPWGGEKLKYDSRYFMERIRPDNTGMEIQSRYEHSRLRRREVRAVSPPSPSVGVGVHIHIARKEGFSVKNMKNLVNIMAAHEEQRCPRLNMQQCHFWGERSL